MRALIVIVAAILLGGAVSRTPAATLPACLSTCGPLTNCCGNDAVTAACSAFRRCMLDAQALFQTCILVDNKSKCYPPSKGRCTFVAGNCGGLCDAKLLGAKDRCLTQAFRTVNDSSCTLDSRRARKLAFRMCKMGSKFCDAAPGPSTTTTSTTSSTLHSTSTTTSTTGTTLANSTTSSTTVTSSTTFETTTTNYCFERCALRRGGIETCYAKCEDSCDGSPAGLLLCRQGCKNDLCGNLKGACTTKGVDSDKQYLACCKKHDDCLSGDEAPCKVTSTTVTTTTESTTTTTAGATTTTSVTTTTL